MAEEDLIARLRATGQSAFSRAMRGAATDVRAVGAETGRVSGRGLLSAASGARTLGREAGSAAVSLRGLATGVAAYKIAGTIKSAVGEGFAYNKMIDGQNVAFTTLLGSQSKAADFMAQIQALALKSPILDPQSTGDSARLLMAYGVSVNKTLPLVEALGDMSATTGKSIAETMPRGAMALGQIAGKGKLQTEELNQLAESVGLSRDKIRRELNLTKDQFNAAFKPGGKGIVDTKALPAILRAMEKSSGGAAERLSKTTGGKLNRLHEVFKKQMGGLTRDVYDAAGDVAGGLAGILQDKDLNFGEKLAAARDVVSRGLTPIVEQFRGWWQREHVGEAIAGQIRASAPVIGAGLGAGIEAAAPVALDAVRGIGSAAAPAFVDAFKAAPAWAQVLVGLGIAKRLGVFSTLGRLAAGRMCGSVASRLPGCIEGKLAGPAGSAGFARVATAIGAGLAASLPAALIAAGLAGVVMAALLPEGREGLSAESGNPESLRGGPQVVQPGDPSGAEIAANRNPERDPGPSRGPAGIGVTPIAPIGRKSVDPFARPGAAPRARRGSGALLNVTVPVKVHAREIGRASASIAADDLAGP